MHWRQVTAGKKILPYLSLRPSLKRCNPHTVFQHVLEKGRVLKRGKGGIREWRTIVESLMFFLTLTYRIISQYQESETINFFRKLDL